MNELSGDFILNEWNNTCAHHVGFYTIHMIQITSINGGTSINIEWLRQYESLRTQDCWRLDLFKVLPRFPYVRADSCEFIYDTSINEVVDVPHRNSPYCVMCSGTWILEPSLVEWLWDRVTMVCHCLIQQLAFNKPRHLAGISFPTIPWPMTLSPTAEAIRMKSCRKNFYLGKKLIVMMARYHLMCTNNLTVIVM